MVDNTGKKMFYGWTIVGIAFLTNFMSVGTSFYVFNAFIEPLCELRNWTRTDISLAMTSGMLIGLLSGILYGTLVIRLGPRIMMTIGPVLAGIAFFFVFQVTELWQFNLVCMLLFFANSSYGGIVSNTVVNNWFEAKRGRAMGISTAGISFSGAVLPLLAMVILLQSDMITASRSIGVLMMLLGPVAWIFVRNWPEDKGEILDGLPKTGQETNGDMLEELEPEHNWQLQELLGNSSFWKLSFTYVLMLIVLIGVMSQLKPRFADLGYSDMVAMTMMAATAFSGGIGKYVWGMLCDRYRPKLVVAAIGLVNIVGLGFALIHGSLTAIVLFIVVYGFSMGGINSTFPIMTAEYFGRRSFPNVMRYLMLILILNLSGFVIAGQSYDRFGSYDPAFILFICFDIVAVLLVLSLKYPNPGSKMRSSVTG